MPSVNVSGLSSGLDTKILLEKIRQNQQERLQPYINSENMHKAKQAAWESITTSLKSLNKSVKTLQNDSFNTFNLNESKSFKATATSEASADTYNIKVNQLATAHKLITHPVEKEIELGSSAKTRTLVITQKAGGETRIILQKNETSLNKLVKAINQQAEHVMASIRLSDDGYRLILGAKKSGVNSEINVRVENDDDLNRVLSTHSGSEKNPDGMYNITDANDAKVLIDKINYTRESNNINDILPGITLELKTVSKTYESLTLTQNDTAVKKDIQDFVKTYNALMTQCSSASKYLPPEKKTTMGQVQLTNPKNGALMGDSALKELIREIGYTVKDIYGSSDSRCRSLADIGIKIDVLTGHMVLDTRKLESAIKANFDEVRNIFTNVYSNSGLTNKLNNVIVRYIGDENGESKSFINETTKILNEQIKKIKEQSEKTKSIIDEQMKGHANKFQQLEVIMSKLNHVNAQLAGMIKKR